MFLDRGNLNHHSDATRTKRNAASNAAGDRTYTAYNDDKENFVCHCAAESVSLHGVLEHCEQCAADACEE